jgi:hypothetical protein
LFHQGTRFEEFFSFSFQSVTRLTESSVHNVIPKTSSLLEFRKSGSLPLLRIWSLNRIMKSRLSPLGLISVLLYTSLWEFASQPKRFFSLLLLAYAANFLITSWDGR